MYDRVSIEDLVSFDGFPADVASAVQHAVLKHPRGRSALYSCPHLHTTVWDALWGERPAAHGAELLVARPLDDTRVRSVLAQESRVGVLTALLGSNQLSREQLELLAHECSSRMVPALLAQDRLSASTRKMLLKRRPAQELAEFMLFEPELHSDDEVLVFLRDIPRQGWVSYTYRSLLVQALLFTRPGTLSTITEEFLLGSTALTAAASSPLLSDEHAHTLAYRMTVTPEVVRDCQYGLMALVNNPVVDASLVAAVYDRVNSLPRENLPAVELATLDDVVASCQHRLKRPVSCAHHARAQDPDELSWLMRRAAPRDYPARPLEIALLLGNPSLSESDKEYLAGKLARELSSRWSFLVSSATVELIRHQGYWQGSLPDDSLPPFAPGTREVPAARASLLEAASATLGPDPQKWETLVSLMDDFSSSFHSLVDASAQL